MIGFTFRQLEYFVATAGCKAAELTRQPQIQQQHLGLAARRSHD
ncbi:hypothetical protein N5D48_12835 [Pseudomonas sp. GD03858]|nr:MULTISPECIES: hypothetical protein [unclassified Pseudomonas]MDH0645568.1 hypothetical protein [Pseudomonas sp. GD03867]MDH0663294.1 hypothetical protein [Pseudomonas sp. GD03858]